jgi:serine protein kinase
MKISSTFKKSFETKFKANDEMTIEEWLDLCKKDKMAYATATERMLAAIGEPEVVDTSTDSRLSRIFLNQKVRMYKAFSDFYGAEEAIERIVAYFRHAAQGLEESKQILYIKGPVGGGKSSLVERLKELMGVHPMYVLKDPNEKNPELQLSPVFESPLWLFNKRDHGKELHEEFGIEPRYLNSVPSGWAQQKLKEFNGDWTQFKVVKIFPSQLNQEGIMKVEPGDENNQDVSVLIGKTDIRKLETFPQNHPYSYSYSGGLNRTSQGFMEFAEMFKANIKTLNPLLMATQEHNYNGSESIPAMPFTGIICAHSNEAEWFTFRNDKSNEAFLDRVYIVNVPYCLRLSDEIKIYEKMISNSSLCNAPIAPETLKMLAEFMVLTRLVEPENSPIYAKMKVYDGQNIKDSMPMSKPLTEYKDKAGVNEGMNGMSTRFGFKLLSQVFNYRPDEVQANPVDLMFILENSLLQEHLPEETLLKYIDFIKSWCRPRYQEFIEKELRIAYLESYTEFAQTIFNNYVLFAEAWIDETQVRDPETHVLLDRDKLNLKCEDIERSAMIHNAKDFRNEIVHYVLRYRAKNNGNMPDWNSYEKIKNVIEKKMFSATNDIMPIISFTPKGTDDEKKKHEAFVQRMIEKGYTTNQVKLLVSWFSDNRKS